MQESGPSQFGPYVVLEQIGSGGMGAVYRARDRRLERDVAVKVLHRHLEISGARERFLREARAVSSLNHPNICTIFDIGEQDGDPYLVMELLEGESLKERLADGDLIPQTQLEDIAKQAALALAAAHGKGIVHRDIKPANLFLVANDDGAVQLKVLDFGLAKIESDRLLYGDSGGLTRTGSTVGTVEYMSPEQARGEELDARSDLFSLGAVLYELATGEVPFRGATSAVVFAELLGSNPIPPRTANAHVSPAMDAIIRQLLEKRRDRRIQSANELMSELRKLHAPAPTAPAPPAPRKPMAPLLPPLPIAPGLSGEHRAAAPLPPGVSREHRVAPADTPPPSQFGERRSAPRPEIEITEPTARAIRQRPTSGTQSSAIARDAVRDQRSSRPSQQSHILRSQATEIRMAAEAVEREREDDENAKGGISGVFIGILVVVILALAAAGFFLWKHGTTTAGASAVFHGALQVTAFENSTGDAVLQEVPATAMQILLRELPSLQLMGYAPAPNTVEQDAADMARQSGAAAYLTGQVSRDSSRYHVHAEILSTADNSRLAQEDVDAASLVELPMALSRLAVQLRSHMGETPEQATANTIPLEDEASGSLTALAMYARGVSLLRAGQVVAAMEPLNRALAEDPTFPLARMALTEALRESGAETERAAAAVPLRSMGPKGSLCLHDQAAYELGMAGDAVSPAQKWSTDCPNQPEALIALTRELTTGGKDAEAEAAAMRAIALDPLGHTANAVATLAMLSQGHFESALKQQQRAAAAHVSSPGLMLLATYLRGDADAETQAAAAAQASPLWADQWNYVTYLSNRGQLAQAKSMAEAAAARFEAQPAIASSARLMRARMAAIQAMAGHCDTNTARTIPSGSEEGHFFQAIALAWCHRPADASITLHDPALSAIARGAQAWGAGDAAGATTILQTAKPSAQSSLAAMIRGEAHLAQKQQVLAIGDYRAVITHRGSAVLTGTIVYPAAHAGLATAYHSMGDQPNATRVESDLKTIWKDADPGESLLHRAEK